MSNDKKIYKYIIIFVFLFFITLIICNFTEDKSNELIRLTYSHLTKNTLEATIELDDSGIPIVDYNYQRGVYIGRQRNPATISQKALFYYGEYTKGDNESKQYFLNCSNWLVNNANNYGNYSTFDVLYPWPVYNMTPPWHSGMAQGQAIQVLIRAHNLMKDVKYLNSAKMLLNSFFIDTNNGGVTYMTPMDGWWYEEYADIGGKESKVLNGMMFSLVAIYEYYEYTNDSTAKLLFDQGIVALKKNLHFYDNNGDSYYDRLQNPAKEYHQIHIELLNQLYNITKEPLLKEYSNKWEHFQKPLFIFRLFQEPTKLNISIFLLNFLSILILLFLLIFLKEKFKTN